MESALVILGSSMTMKEQQNIEWKEVWRDEYLKWICGFANAQGGKIYIGIDDNGKVIGFKDNKKLLEDIPNKVRDTLGIIVDVNRLTEGCEEYIEIIVKPSTYPVDYKGEYHYRSGSTKQQLRGAALTEFLLSRTGFKWDAVPIDDVLIDDLDKESFDIFRREALRTKRMTEADLQVTNAELLENLHLINDGKLKRAAILLFHREPERWFSGSYIKVAYFGEGSDLRYQEEIHGSLMIQADRTVELIYLKFMKAYVSYDGLIRVETYPFPKDGIREAVYNSIMHCDYSASTPIQIRIHEDVMYIGNRCIFPAGWTVETLMAHHNSLPHNPDVANGFFRAGYVETWGRGVERICEECIKHGIPIPEYTLYPEDIVIRFNGIKPSKAPKLQSRALDGALENELLTIIVSNPKISQNELANELGIGRKKVQTIMKKLIEIGVIKRKGGKRYGSWEVNQCRDSF
jgi:ATP-dependent DNA helicase RecG